MREIETDIGIVAPPISYLINGEQYVAVLAGWGGVPPIVGADAGVAATKTHTNPGHVLAFKLGGKAAMPEVETKRFTMVPPPPADNASPEMIARGERLYHQNCAVCHGLSAVSSGVVTDLRFASKAVHESFDKIVLEGIIGERGMAKFSDLLSADDVKAIHSYLISRTKEDYEAQQKAAGH